MKRDIKHVCESATKKDILSMFKRILCMDLKIYHIRFKVAKNHSLVFSLKQ